MKRSAEWQKQFFFAGTLPKHNLLSLIRTFIWILFFFFFNSSDFFMSFIIMYGTVIKIWKHACWINQFMVFSRQTDDKFWIKWMCVFFLLKTITNMSNNAIKVVNKGCTNEELERKKQRKLCWPYCQEPACLNEVGCKGTHDHRMKT